MKRSLLITLLIALVSALSAYADEPAQKPERKQWMKEMRRFKHEFLTKELELTSEQQSKFFPSYDKMEEEMRAIERQTRQLERDITKKGDEATDLEYEKAAEACYELPSKKNAVEMRYFKEYKEILTKKQLFKLSGAERKFTRIIMHHRKGPEQNKQK